MKQIPVDDKVWIDSKKTFVGGQGANAAQGMSIMGLPVSFLTRLGDDEDGSMALRRYQELRLQTDHCITVPQAQTMSACVTIATEAQTRSCLMYRDQAMFAYDIGDRLRAVDLDSFGLVYTDGHQTEDLVLPIVRAARAKGKPVVADVEVLDEHTRELADLATDLVAPAASLQRLAAELSGSAQESMSPGDAALSLANRQGQKTVVATCGKQGSYGARHGMTEAVYMPAHKDCKAVDTVGAGDAYHAGYIVALAEGVEDLQERMAFATRVAAALCETPGPVVSQEALLRYGILSQAES